jgi:hypothetical protein
VELYPYSPVQAYMLWLKCGNYYYMKGQLKYIMMAHPAIQLVILLNNKLLNRGISGTQVMFKLRGYIYKHTYIQW